MRNVLRQQGHEKIAVFLICVGMRMAAGDAVLFADSKNVVYCVGDDRSSRAEKKQNQV